MPVASGVSPVQARPRLLAASCPVERVTGLPALSDMQFGPLSVSVLLGLFSGHSRPQMPQNRGMPVPFGMRMVLPSALTMPWPAIFHSPVPPIGLPSKYQILIDAPGSPPTSFGSVTGIGVDGTPPIGVPKKS